MKPNNINTFLNKYLKSSNVEQEIISNTKAVYDDFMSHLVNKIKMGKNVDDVTDVIMDLIKKGDLEQVRGNLYKYNDIHILELLKRDGMDYSNKLKKLDNLNLGITQKYIETIEKDGTVYIVTSIQGTEKGELIPLWKRGIKNIPKENRLEAFQDLQKLTKEGLIDDKVARSDDLWFVNADDKIILPQFEYLRPIREDESQVKIIENYYNILFNY